MSHASGTGQPLLPKHIESTDPRFSINFDILVDRHNFGIHADEWRERLLNEIPLRLAFLGAATFRTGRCRRSELNRNIVIYELKRNPHTEITDAYINRALDELTALGLEPERPLKVLGYAFVPIWTALRPRPRWQAFYSVRLTTPDLWVLAQAGIYPNGYTE